MLFRTISIQCVDQKSLYSNERSLIWDWRDDIYEFSYVDLIILYRSPCIVEKFVHFLFKFFCNCGEDLLIYFLSIIKKKSLNTIKDEKSFQNYKDD